MSSQPYQRYRDSGVEWLGKIPAHWQVERLKFRATVNDEVLEEDTPTGYEILYVDINGVDAEAGITDKEPMLFGDAPSRARRRVRDGDTILSTVRTYLRAIAAVRHPESNLIVSTGFAVIRPRRVEAEFLAWSLRSSCFIETVVSRSVGVSYPAINASEVMDIPVAIPNRPEQRAIADYLACETTRIDALVAAKERLLEILAEKRRALITLAVTRGLNPNVRLRDSGLPWLGKVPEHWRVLALKRLVVSPVTDGPHETPDFVGTGVPFVSAEAVWGGRIHLEAMRGYITREAHETYSQKYCPKQNDVYVVKSGATTGKVAIVDLHEEFNIWSPLAAIRCDTTLALPWFVFHALGSDYFQGLVKTSWSQGTQPNIGMEVLENLPAVVPPVPEQCAIVEHIERETSKLDALRAAAERTIGLLKERRAALIAAAVTGKVGVAED